MGHKTTKTNGKKKEGVDRSGRKTLPSAQKSVMKSFSLEAVAEAFSYKFFNEERCRAWMFEKLHPEGAQCPDCGLTLDGAARESFWAGRRCSCNRCGRRFTARTGTFLEGAQLADRQIYAMAVLYDLGFSTGRAAEILGVTPNTVRLWSTRLKAFSENIR